MSGYEEPDIMLVPQYDVNLCEKCGKVYGNCRHHPFEVPHNVMTKAELKQLYDKQQEPTYRNLGQLTDMVVKSVKPPRGYIKPPSQSRKVEE